MSVSGATTLRTPSVLMSPGTIEGRTPALRFLFTKTLGRRHQAAGHAARVLALDEAKDISVSRYSQQLVGRRAHHREDCLEGGGGGPKHAGVSKHVSRYKRGAKVQLPPSPSFQPS